MFPIFSSPYFTVRRLQAYLFRFWEEAVSLSVKNRKEGVGLIFFAAVLFLGHYTIFSSTISKLPTAVRIPILLRSAEGISQGTSVFVQGVRMGYTESLTRIGLGARGGALVFDKGERGEEYQESQGNGIIAVLCLKQRIDFYSNYRVILKYRTTLSTKIIEILPGSSSPSYETAFLPGVPFLWGRWDRDNEAEDKKDRASKLPKKTAVLELSYEEVQDFQNTGVLPKRDHLLRSSNYDSPLYLFVSMLYENQENLSHIVSNLRDITHKINTGRGTIGAFINKSDIANGVNSLLEQGIYLTNETRDGLESIRESNSAVRFLFIAYSIAASQIDLTTILQN